MEEKAVVVADGTANKNSAVKLEKLSLIGRFRTVVRSITNTVYGVVGVFVFVFDVSYGSTYLFSVVDDTMVF